MMGGSFFNLYYSGRFSIYQLISVLLVLAVLGFGLWANRNMYRSRSAEVLPQDEDTAATAASAAATYVPTGQIPVVEKKAFYD